MVYVKTRTSTRTEAQRQKSHEYYLKNKERMRARYLERREQLLTVKRKRMMVCPVCNVILNKDTEQFHMGTGKHKLNQRIYDLEKQIGIAREIIVPPVKVYTSRAKKTELSRIKHKGTNKDGTVQASLPVAGCLA